MLKYLYNLNNLIFYQPLLNILILFYQTIAFQDLGLAIIFLTILIRLILFPVFQKSVQHQTVMQKLQPKLQKIQSEHRNDPEKQSKAMMDLYREHKINPFSGFFLLLIQLPVLIALYSVFRQPLTPEVLQNLYYFIKVPGHLNNSFLGLINLEQTSILMTGLASLAQYFQGRLSLKTSSSNENSEPTTAEKVNRQMVFLAPLITLMIFINWPAAVSLYWLVTSAFSIFQQEIVNRKLRFLDNEQPRKFYQETN